MDCAKLKRELGGAGALTICGTSEKSNMHEDLDGALDNAQVTWTGRCIRSYCMATACERDEVQVQPVSKGRGRLQIRQTSESVNKKHHNFGTAYEMTPHF